MSSRHNVTAIPQAQPTAFDRAAGRVIETWPALLAFVLGGFILYGVGFAGADVLHNAAHDSRHAITFPCH